MDRRTVRMACAAALFLGTLGVGSSAFAAKKFQIGVKGGANLATFVGNDAEPEGDDTTKKSRLGLSGGAQAAINFGMFGVQPELLYSQRGVKTETSTDNYDSSSTVKLNYLSLPILGRLNLSLPGIPLTLKVLAGPVFSQYLSGETETTTESQGSTETNTNSLDSEDVSSPTFGVSGGGGLEFGLGPGALTLDVRYTREFSQVYNAEERTSDTQLKADDLDEQFNSFFSGHVGFVIGF